MSDAALGLVPILEAALMAASEPLPIVRMCSLFDEPAPTPEEIKQALETLQEQAQGHSFELVKVASGYRYQVSDGYSYWVSRLFDLKPQNYSRALMETLAIIAYRQPVSRGDIEEIRAVSPSSPIMHTLLEREWIEVIGHKKTPGAPALYGTTKRFLDDFNLASLEELPQLSDAEPLMADLGIQLSKSDQSS